MGQAGPPPSVIGRFGTATSWGTSDLCFPQARHSTPNPLLVERAAALCQNPSSRNSSESGKLARSLCPFTYKAVSPQPVFSDFSHYFQAPISCMSSPHAARALGPAQGRAGVAEAAAPSWHGAAPPVSISTDLA